MDGMARVMEIPTFSTGTQLNAAGHLLPVPFFLELKSSVEEGKLICREVLRVLPEKRVVVRGEWLDMPVVAKVYLSTGSARRYADREISGVTALKAAAMKTPSVVLRAALSGDGSPVILFQELPGAQTLAEILDVQADKEGRRGCLERATETVAELHSKGLVQKDIHPDNFLMSEGELFVIDADSIDSTHSGKPLGRWPSLVNLGLFMAQFPSDTEALFPDLFDRYSGLRGWEGSDCTFAELNRHISEQWNLRKDRYLRKIFRTSTAHIARKEPGRYRIWRRDWDGEDARSFMEDPDGYMERGQILKRGNSSTVVKVLMNGQSVVVKRYNIKNFWHGLRRCLRVTRAATSWRNAHLLEMIGVRTAVPLLVLERRWAFLRGTAYFVCRFIDGRDILQLLNEAEPGFDCERDWRVPEFVRMLRMFRKHGLSHGDMKATNFIESGGHLWVIDLDAMKEHADQRSHGRALDKDRARWMKNWSGLPKVQECFGKAMEEAGFR